MKRIISAVLVLSIICVGAYLLYDRYFSQKHNYSDQLKFDSTHHFYECVHCGKKKSVKKHVSSGEATAGRDEVCRICGYVIEKGSGLSFSSLSVDGDEVYGKVSNSTAQFSFSDEIRTAVGTEYTVSFDRNGSELTSETVSLKVGDNVFYVTEIIDGEKTQTYTVTIRRRAVYTVVFVPGLGMASKTVSVEEDSLIEAPSVSHEGYTLVGWDYDFSIPVTEDLIISASWSSGGGTSDTARYKVEYYLESPETERYALHSSEEYTQAVGSYVTAEKKVFENYTFNIDASKLGGTVSKDGSLVLRLYYSLSVYTLSNADAECGRITGVGSYKYGVTAPFTATVSSVQPGYKFDGWYSGGVLLSKEKSYLFTVDRNVEARFIPDGDMGIFYFESDGDSCTITGLRDKTLTEIVIPESVTAIGDHAFENCTSLVSVSFGDGVKTVGISAFEGCASLRYVSFGDSVERIDNAAFRDCVKLVSIKLPDRIDYIGSYAFEGCYRLVEVIKPSSFVITDDCKAKTYALEIHSGESKLKAVGDCLFYSVNGKNYLVDYVGVGGSLSLPSDYSGEEYVINTNAFKNYTHLTSLIIPDSATSIGSYAFTGCTSLSKVTIGDGVKEINSSAFYMCTSLGSVTLGDSVEIIYSQAFGDCASLTEIILPDSVKELRASAFSGCKNLVSIVIGKSVKKINDSAFSGCEKLDTVYYRSTGADWNLIKINENGNSYLTGADRYYYSETSEDGKYWHFDQSGKSVVW
jgi:hypothetical protein